MDKSIVKKISHKKLRGLPILVMLVGESGSGKTTFVKMMDCEDNWFESSRAMVNVLLARGEPINHDSIHSFANRMYKKNPGWQVPNILNALRGKKFLLFDGPRRIEEVRAVLASHPRVLVVRIVISSKLTRFARLQGRDNIDKDGFERLLRDESGETELSQIISLADFTIFNDGSIEDVRRQAIEFKNALLASR
jgi:hypothetical protein